MAEGTAMHTLQRESTQVPTLPQQPADRIWPELEEGQVVQSMAEALKRARSRIEDAHKRAGEEAKQAIGYAMDRAREEAKREAVGIIAEARRRADEIVRTARQEAERVIAKAKEQAQTEVEETARRRALSTSPSRGVPPPFVDPKGNHSHHVRMPVFWA